MHKLYPLPIDNWMVGAIALILTLVGLWAYRNDGLPHSLGNMALPIVFVTAFGWFTDMPEAAAWAVASVATALWFVGMLMPARRDDAWHFGALAVAWLGKLVAWTLPWFWAILTGQVTVPLVVLLLLIALAVVGIAGWRSEKVRNRFGNARSYLRRRRVRTA